MSLFHRAQPFQTAAQNVRASDLRFAACKKTNAPPTRDDVFEKNAKGFFMPSNVLFAASNAARSAAYAGEDENEPHQIATAHSAHIAAAAAARQEHQKQNEIASVAAASVCAVCEKSVHICTSLKILDCSYITLRNLGNLCYRGIESGRIKYNWL